MNTTTDWRGKAYKTRFKELIYRNMGDHWRIFDVDGDAAVGPQFHSRIELLCDLERYAKFFGCEVA